MLYSHICQTLSATDVYSHDMRTYRYVPALSDRFPQLLDELVALRACGVVHLLVALLYQAVLSEKLPSLVCAGGGQAGGARLTPHVNVLEELVI